MAIISAIVGVLGIACLTLTAATLLFVLFALPRLEYDARGEKLRIRSSQVNSEPQGCVVATDNEVEKAVEFFTNADVYGGSEEL